VIKISSCVKDFRIICVFYRLLTLYWRPALVTVHFSARWSFKG